MFSPLRTLAFFLLICTSCSSIPRSENARTPDLVLIATADFHAAIDRAEDFAIAVQSIRARYPNNSLHFDGGDLFQGSLEDSLSKGRVMVDLYNVIGVDAAAIGNHELDHGPAAEGRINLRRGEDGLGNIKKRVKEAKFAWLSANILVKNAEKCLPGPRCNALGQRTIFAPRFVFNKGETRTCAIGASTPSTEHIMIRDFIKDARFESLPKLILAETKWLRENEKCDFVVLVAHAGLLCDKKGRCLERGDRAEILELLEKLPPRTLDAVVAGHTHLKAQEVINGTPVIESGAYASTVGTLKLWKNGSHEFEDWITVEKNASMMPAVTEALKKYREQARYLKQKPVGASLDQFEKTRATELPLGNLVADALLEYAKNVDPGVCCSFVNQGGIRTDLPRGEILYGDVFKILPFENSLTIVSLTGSELTRLLEIGTSGGHGIFPVSGLELTRIAAAQGQRGTWDRDLDGNGVSEDWERNLLVEAKLTSSKIPIQPHHRYKVATIDFLAQGGDHLSIVFDKVKKSRIITYQGVFLRDIFVEYLKRHSPLSIDKFKTPKRIKEID